MSKIQLALQCHSIEMNKDMKKKFFLLFHVAFIPEISLRFFGLKEFPCHSLDWGAQCEKASVKLA